MKTLIQITEEIKTYDICDKSPKEISTLIGLLSAQGKIVQKQGLNLLVNDKEDEKEVYEAEPVPGFKPASPSRPRGPAKAAIPSRTRAQVMTPRGRLSTVKTPGAMRRPGYRFIKYLPPKERTARSDRRDKQSKPARKPIKPVAYGRAFNEMKITRFDIDEKSTKWSDPGDYPSGAGSRAMASMSSNSLAGFAEVTFDASDIKKYQGNQDDLENAIYDLVKKEISDEFGRSSANDASLKLKKIGANKYRVDVKDLYEVKSLAQLIKETRK